MYFTQNKANKAVTNKEKSLLSLGRIWAKLAPLAVWTELIELVSEAEVLTADDCSLDVWVAEVVDASLLDVATPPFSSARLSDEEDCWVVGATVDLLEVEAIVEEMVDTVAVEEVAEFLVDEVEDCLWKS